MRSWMSSTSSLAAVVMMQNVRMTSPDRLNLKVVPQCWFVRDVIDRRPEFQNLLRAR